MSVSNASVVAFSAVLLLTFAAPVAVAADACANLTAPEAVVFEATPRWVDTEALPRYCRVRGTIENRVNFEMRLPEEWSGRFLMAGCGGFCGELLPDKPGHSNAINEALKRGYAGISHDSGHQANSWETHWAADPEALLLWAHKSLPVVTRVGSQLATALYGSEPRYKYFSGCSNGGRMGLQAAQRYPELFDGIAAGGSIFELSGIAGLWGNWLISNNQSGANSRVSQDSVPVLEDFVMSRCDAVDGLADGIIDDPRNCRVDFSELACAATGQGQPHCLSGEEISVLNTLYGGVRNGRGELVYPSVAFGSEHYADRWLFGAPGQPAWGVLASAGYRQMLAADLGVADQPGGLSTDQMLDWISRSSVPALTDATNPDLTGLRRSNTKLLIYHGWSDPLIIPEPITRYYMEAVQRAGGLAPLQNNARLFMVPGWGHCWEKPGAAPDQFDPLLALEQWVEQGDAPDFLVVGQPGSQGAQERSRPVCAYPSVARLEPGTDPDNYRNYRCIDDSPAADS